MNLLTIIGNLTADPVSRTTQAGKNVTTFTVAVNRRKTANAGQPEADYFRVSAWGELGANCQKWLIKGKKVCVVGHVSVSTYKAQNDETRANMDVFADSVEFLSPANTVPGEKPVPQTQNESIGENKRYKPGEVPAQPSGGGFTQVDDEELPF
jgi:single-strand DNA-binding protein